MNVNKRWFWTFMLLVIFILPACKTMKMTPIVKATDLGNLSEVNYLLAQGVGVDEATPEGVTPLFVASAKGHEDIVKRLIDKGADVNAVTTKAFKYEDRMIYEGRTPLMEALRNKHTDIAEILIQQGADVNAVDVNGATSLFIAAALNDEAIVKILIEKGADVNTVILNEYEYKGVLVIKGATPLMAALKMEQNANAAVLVAHGADVNARSDDGVDSLMIAALNGDAQMANFLLSRGANHETRVAKDSRLKGRFIFEGVTTLMIAAGAGHMESLVTLIGAGSDVNAVSQKGTTALMAASANGHLDIVKLLVAKGADVNAQTNEPYNLGEIAVHAGSSPLGLAAYNGRADVVKFLIENGADVNANDDFGMDPLYLAAEKGYLQVAKILIENNADVFSLASGTTALNAANRGGHVYIAKFIKAARDKIMENKSEVSE
ncbi:MAG: ankyrin repeat domain-containing protein [Desulfobacteraceae bacterium]|jgi:ankyrin repeat protein|nr:ankyrin repeat domain-containing protein [Desulfobacteraceae bacterium]